MHSIRPQRNLLAAAVLAGLVTLSHVPLAQAQEEAPRRRSRRLATSQAFDADDKPVVPQAPAEPAAVEPAPVQEANQ